MSPYEVKGASISIEHEYLRDGQFQDILSIYDDGGCCCGDFDVTNEDIYEVENPYFPSDIFVFQEKRFKDVETVCFIKLNINNKIEEIGVDFSSRFCLEKDKDYKKATPVHKIPFLLIDDEMWASMQERRKQRDIQVSHTGI